MVQSLFIPLPFSQSLKKTFSPLNHSSVFIRLKQSSWHNRMRRSRWKITTQGDNTGTVFRTEVWGDLKEKWSWGCSGVGWLSEEPITEPLTGVGDDSLLRNNHTEITFKWEWTGRVRKDDFSSRESNVRRAQGSLRCTYFHWILNWVLIKKKKSYEDGL